MIDPGLNTIALRERGFTRERFEAQHDRAEKMLDELWTRTRPPLTRSTRAIVVDLMVAFARAELLRKGST